MFTLRARSCTALSSYRTSLPVVVEDTTDTDVTDDIIDSSADYCQEVLQQTLDLCLDHLDKLQLMPVTACPTKTSGAHYADSMVISSKPTSSSEGGKSDSGFWSQSFDNYRSSMATLEDAVEDVDLDAILGELCALGDELENERRRTVQQQSTHATHSPITALATSAIPSRNSLLQQDAGKIPSNTKFSPSFMKPPLPHKPNFEETILPPGHHHSTMSNGMIINAKSVSPVAATAAATAVECFDLVEHYYKQVGANADSPDNDSAFSDNVSCISSESGASRTDASCMSSGSSKSSNGSLNAPSPTQTTTGSDGSALTKTEKIKIALEKINEGDTKKLFVTVHFNDEVRKSLLIDDRMECLDVCRSLAEKSDTKLTPDCTIVEYLPELHIERFFEDHENLVENLLMWDRDGNSKNKLLYVERKDKYHFIVRPETYLVGFACKDTDYDELSRRALLKDYFSSHAISPPELEDYLYLKTDGKKAWKRYWFVLRASGLYYSTKPKTKQTSSADLICLTAFDAVNLYRGLNWKKKHKAPSDFGFALKLPQIQSVKALKNIRFISTDDQASLELWMTGIRIAKYGRHLIDNFNKALERAAAMEAAQESNNSSAQQTPVLNRRSHPNADSIPSYSAFDDDPPTGTIKRKPPHTNPPSGTPKLPFTSKTSQLLMRNADERRSFTSQSSRTSHSSDLSEPEVLPPPPPELLSPTTETLLPMSPTLLRSPPPTPPKPPALQRKPSFDAKKPLESRHSIGPASPSHSAHTSTNLPFLHELKSKSQSPLVTKKILACVPEIHDIHSQPSSPARVAVASPSPVMPSSPARMTNGHSHPRPQSMSPSHKPRLPPPPPRRSDMTKLTDAELALQRKSEGYPYERSVSLGNEGLQAQRYVATSNAGFMADLMKVLAQKKRHSLLLHEIVPADGTDYLPPPPPELLKGISSLPLNDDLARRRPPPPPKRSDGTYLTRAK